ncbi:hypothetical protein CC79DRAFT_1294463 [Sarocladium strictum]
MHVHSPYTNTMDPITKTGPNHTTSASDGAHTENDIAVIGFSFKLPQNVNDVDNLWDVLEKRRNLMTPFPADRIDSASFLSGKRKKFNCQGGYFINQDPAEFDAPFFSISTKEAAVLDPMQRWTLETSYRAFENAGIPVEKLRGSRTAVFSASFTDDWSRMVSQDPENTGPSAATGTASSLIPNRLSWYFDLRGPSVHIDTACSSSLVALDMACQSIRAGDASAALVTGSSLILTPTYVQFLSDLGFLSADSKCWTFDPRANGYARGEGFVSMVLKPITAAVRDGDMIRAVIRASGTNQDGHTPSLTQPSSKAQEELIRHVYRKAKLSFDQTRYFEAHGKFLRTAQFCVANTFLTGTGTPVGDPIEMKAIGNVFRTSRSAEEPLYVGSLKTNIGHLEGSSGLAGIVKCIVSMEKGVIPPHALFEELNPDIDAEFYNTAIPLKAIPWPTNGLRRVSVNSFGWGGANAHAVLDDGYHYLQDRCLLGNHCTNIVPTNGATTDGAEEIHTGVTSDTDKSNGVADAVTNNKAPRRLLVWSAPDEKALRRMMDSQRTFYETYIAGDKTKLDQLAFTLAERRSRMLWRASTITSDIDGSSTASKLFAAQPHRSSGEVGLAFVLTGQGAQYASMGLELVDQFPLFKETLQSIGETFRRLGCEWDLFKELGNGDAIDRPEYSQPLSTAVQIGLLELLKSFDVIPKVVIGHSSGEIAAAYAIGALSLESACKVSYFRGLLAGRLRAADSQAGGMISVNLAEADIAGYLDKVGISGVSVACINSPNNCTLSGPESAIDAIKEQAEKESLFARKLMTGVAYHSPAMLAIADEYKQLMGKLEAASGVQSRTRLISTVTGQAARHQVLATAQYWVDNMVSPVRFSDAMQALTRSSSSSINKGFLGSITDVVEIGPTAALRRPVLDSLTDATPRSKQIRYASFLHRGRSAVSTMLELVGHLFTRGHPVSVTAANQLKSGSRLLVDLPEYPFDHSNKYWAESRLSRDYRLRGAVKGETLGFRASDWNPLEPRWRSFLSTERDPWLAHHNVSGTVIYPAAGMLIMAMEAVWQMVSANRTVAGYLIKEASFLNPIIIGEAWEDRTEVVVELRPLHNSFDKASTWSDVRIFSHRNKEGWSECFRSRIQVQHEEDALQTDVQREKDLADKDGQRRYQRAVETCERPVDTQVFYHNAGDHGLQYGDMFQLLDELHWDGKKTAVAQIDVSPSRFSTSSLVHPAVLDVALHMLRASSQAFGSTSRTNVPVSMKDAWFASSGWQTPQTETLRCWGVAHVGRDAGEDGAIYALDDGGRLLMSVDHLVTMSVSDVEASTDPAATRLLHTARWKPQLSLLDAAQLSQACAGDKATLLQCDDDDARAQEAELTSIMNLALSRTLSQMTPTDHGRVPATLERHIAWMKHHLSTLQPNQQDNPTTPMTNEQLEARLQGLEAVRPSWKLYIDIVRAVHPILVGAIDPLEIIYDAGLADRFYDDMFSRVCDTRLHNFLDLLSHENPALRILEVGAGTGGFTGHVLGYLQSLEDQNGGGLRLVEYTYTDISPTFFERARERWKFFDGRVRFKTLDLEQPLEIQGFELGSYDLLVAGSVLHATTDIAKTMRNVRSALKSGGRTLILELVAPENVAVNFTFGLVPGWWAAREEWRALSPLLTEEQWDVRLRESGFSGNDVVLGDGKDGETHTCSILISTAIETLPVQPSPEEQRRRIILIVDEASEKQISVANLICSQVDRLSIGCRYSISQVSHEAVQKQRPGRDDIIVSLANFGSPFFFNMSSERFTWLQNLLRNAKQLLWVSGASQDDPQLPLYDQAQGFFRSLRLEVADSHIVSLMIEQQTNDDAGETSSAQDIILVLRASFLDHHQSSNELEYMVKDGLLQTCRVVEDHTGNVALNAMLYPQMHNDKAWADGPALALTTRAQGTLDSLCFMDDDVHETDLKPGEVEIDSKAWGVNFLDVSQALGRVGHDGDKDFGVDCAGIITRINQDHYVKQYGRSLQVGDRVCMLSPGCMRRYPRAPSTSVIKIPNNDLSYSDAVSGLVPGITAHHALINIARIAKGETILIHSAAGATGQMAVAVAKMRGAIIYATVGSEAKKRFLVDVLDIPEHHIFHSRNTSFAQGIMRVTGGRGVDVVLNSLSGDALRASFDCMARCGRFLEIGKTDMVANSALSMAGFFRNVSFSGIDLRDIIHQDPELTADLLHKTMQLVCDTGARPTPVQSFPASQAEQAFRTLQKGTNIGRVVIEPGLGEIVPQHIIERRPWRFESNATYLIAGGWGGIGRAIMLWMAQRGARHIIAPSRSGAASKAAKDVLAELQGLGVHLIAPQCDVASESSLSKVLDDCARTMPPIKGCINAALALQDAMFDNMTLEQWHVAVKAKIDTAWNLHNLLPRDLTFFVLLSSLAGIIGQMATANYAGGCTFQDALARHRVQHGMKAVSLDIGWMKDIGIVSESAAFQRHRLITDDMKQIDARSLMALLSICCDPTTPLMTPEQSQMLVGLRTPADFLAKGRTPPVLLNRPLFSVFSRVANTEGSSHAGQRADAAALFRTATEPAEKAEVVVKALVTKLARAMDMSAGDVQLSKPLSSYGVDSLMAVELRNWIKGEFAAPVAVFDIMGGLPISSIGELVVSRSTLGAA